MLIRGSVDKYDRETSQHIVAYLDILGIAERMKAGYECQNLAMNKLHNLYTLSKLIWKDTVILGSKYFPIILLSLRNCRSSRINGFSI
ncbi:hypothetical protein [Bacillus chungangensis]|uniref:Uncharacterized protein n=1 Tax=Bacillus chungangensis TaxID=587633 RepID=A0ABT9WYM4_9BACI|nr:hypothetical protein [Bacillus chungangensis]MDQ0178219.1 hypothetical protein [Bacillus chungangensis]